MIIYVYIYILYIYASLSEMAMFFWGQMLDDSLQPVMSDPAQLQRQAARRIQTAVASAPLGDSARSQGTDGARCSETRYIYIYIQYYEYINI